MKGYADQVDYGMRAYDPRVGRFLSTDPITKQYPELTPYQYASNRPVDGVDKDGKEWELSTTNSNLHKIPQIRYDAMMRSAGSIKGWDGDPGFWVKVKLIGEQMNRVGQPGLSVVYGVFDDAHVTYTGWKNGPMDATHLDHSSVGSYKERITAGINTTTLVLGGIQAVGEAALIKGLSAVESQILNQSKSILNSKEFDVIRNAYKNGVSAEINVKGTPVLYDPAYTYFEAMTLQQEGGFVLGPKAFVAKGGVDQTVLWEVSRLKTQSGNSLGFGETREYTDEAEKTSEKLLPYLNKKK